MPDLFLPLPQAARTEREKLGKVVDNINRRFGADTVSFGYSKPHNGFERSVTGEEQPEKGVPAMVRESLAPAYQGRFN